MHREHVLATSNVRLFQLQQQYNTLSGISCFVSSYTNSSIPWTTDKKRKHKRTENEQTQGERQEEQEKQSKQRKAKPEEKRTKNKNREGEKVALAIQHTFATVFDFASCTGKFFISLCFAILIAWVLYIGQFNSLLLHTRVKLSPRKKIIKI